MKIFIRILFLVLLFLTPLSATAKPVVAVLSLDSNNVATYSYIVNNASAMIAEDTTNAFRQGLVFDTKKILFENLPQRDVVQLQSSYANAGYVDYDKLDKLNKTIKADYILLLTSYMDIQSHLLDETIWNKLNVAGLDTFEPKYYLYTHALFWNTKDKTVLWEKMYENKMAEKDFNIMNPVSTPNYVQIKHVKKFSTEIANDIAFRSKFLVFGPSSDKDVEEYQRREGKYVDLYYKKTKGFVQSVSKSINDAKPERTNKSRVIEAKRVKSETNEVKINNTSGQLKPYDFIGSSYNKTLEQCQGNQCSQEVVKCFRVLECEPKRNFLNLKFNKKLLE